MLAFRKITEYVKVDTVFADFEMATRTQWLQVIVRGCRFHLTQSWWKQIQEVGLSIKFKNGETEIGQLLKLLFGLPLLSPNNVKDCFYTNFWP